MAAPLAVPARANRVANVAAAVQRNGTMADRLERTAAAMYPAPATFPVRNRSVVLVNPDVEGAVVMDYALHDYRQADGRSLVERFCSPAFDREAASLDGDEAEVRRHRATARFALLEICDLVVGLGAHACDVLRGGEPFLLADVGLSRTGAPGCVIAIRTVDAGAFRMTTGAPLPVDAVGLEAAFREVARLFGANLDGLRRLPPVQQSRLARHVLRICLQRYADLHEDPPEE